MTQTFSTADVASHNKTDNLYIIVDEDVYDLTKFQDEHPGMLRIPRQNRDMANIFQVGRRVCLIPAFIPSTTNTAISPPAGGRKGRIEAILEVSQREHPQEIQRPAAGRLLRLEEEGRPSCA